MKEIENIIKQNPGNVAFKYMLLDRMKSDCKYYLGSGNRLNKYLWAGSVSEHIACMRALWNSFTEEGKPEWLTLEQIADFENAMI